jgi:hypothetical protein
MLGVMSSFITSSTSAAIIRLSPFSANVINGGSLSIGVFVRDLGAHALGAFDVSVAYDPALVSPTGAVNFGSALGDPALFEALTDVNTATPRILEFAETSLLSTAQLLALQPPSGFLLATLSFNAIGSGTAQFSITNALLADAATGGALPVAIPEPETLVLLLSGLGALGLARTRSQPIRSDVATWGR